MKKIKVLLILLMLGALNGCSSENETISNEIDTSFLRDIRPRYFEQLNFNSEEKKAEIPAFLSEFTLIYKHLEQEYCEGMYSSNSDLEYFRLASNYYSFVLLALVRAYMDDIISFDEIIGSRTDYFSNLDPNNENFEMEELKSMMERAEEVSYFSVYVNGYNDKSYGFFLAIRQIHERLLNENFVNDAAAQDAIIYYSNTDINDFTIISNWNVLMSMVTINNYSDSLNTFQYPKMNILFASANRRLVPNSLGDLNDRYPVILGPMYRFDLLMKKIDHLINTNTILSEEDLNDLDQYISGLILISKFIENDQSSLLNSWEFTETFFQRKQKIDGIKAYYDGLVEDNGLNEIPELRPFLESKDFNQAYQCYSCHQSPN